MTRPHLSYANVISTLALFLALSGGAAFAADKIQSDDIADGAVKAAQLHQRAVISGKLAVGAVRRNQIAAGAVGSEQIAASAVSSRQIGDGAVGSKQIAPSSVAPSNLQVPLYFPASPTGGSVPVPSGEPIPYPLANNRWTQNPGQINVIFGSATATIAYDGDGSGSCQVFFGISLNGRQVGGGELSSGSTDLERVEAGLGAQPEVDPLTPMTNNLTVMVGSNGDCTTDSVVDSSRFRVIDFG